MYKVTIILVGALVAIAHAAPFIPIPSPFAPLAVALDPLHIIGGAAAIVPRPVAVQLDGLLQAKLNTLLGLVGPVSGGAVPLAAAKPVPAAEPTPLNLEASASQLAVQSSSSGNSNPWETASASSTGWLTSYGVPAKHVDTAGFTSYGLPLPGGTRADDAWQSPPPAAEQVHLTDDQQQYISSYQLEDGTQVQEQGRFVPTGNGAEVAFVKQGHYEYKSPEGTPVKVNWVADQNGYRVLEN